MSVNYVLSYEYNEEFNRVLDHYNNSPGLNNPREIPLLIILNKIDLMNSDTLLEVKEKVVSMIITRNISNPFSIRLVSAKSNVGIEDAFKWFISLKLMQ